MHHQIPFTKVSGAGNDFVLVDNMSMLLQVDWVRFARTACSRPFGIGADGLLVIEPSDMADFTMKYYNADGSYGGMCGNGGRCVARYASLQGIAGNKTTFHALGHVYQARVEGASVILKMQNVAAAPRRLSLVLDHDMSLDGFFVDTASPHLVVLSGELDSEDVQRVGRAARNHPALGPDGANINFYSLNPPGGIQLRTYERGVEAETLACGTGAVAAALVAWCEFGMNPPVQVQVRSGETLIVGFAPLDNSFADIELKGSSHILFSGTIVFDPDAGIVDSEPSRSL